jgi:hypothetical protein
MYIEEIEMCIPVNLENTFEEAASESVKQTEEVECCICYEPIGEKNNCVTQCGHKFCLKCLMMSMSRNNTCPCCRTELIPSSEEEDDQDEDFEDDEEEEEAVCEIEELTERLQKNGFTMVDILSMLIQRYSTRNEKYTPEFIDKMNDQFDQILIDADNEMVENQMFGLEDVRTN